MARLAQWCRERKSKCKEFKSTPKLGKHLKLAPVKLSRPLAGWIETTDPITGLVSFSRPRATGLGSRDPVPGAKFEGGRGDNEDSHSSWAISGTRTSTVCEDASQLDADSMQIISLPIEDGIELSGKKKQKRKESTSYWEPPKEERQKTCGLCLGRLGYSRGSTELCRCNESRNGNSSEWLW